MECKKCGGRLSRIKREGLLESYIYSAVGMYPWKCVLCKVRVMLKNRGERKRRSEPREEAG